MRRVLGTALMAGLLLGAAGAAAQTPEVAPPVSLEACFACHGEGGVSRIPTRPNIAGQKASYVARQLQAFKRAAVERKADNDGDADNVPTAQGGVQSATRSDPVMSHAAEVVRGSDIAALAAAVSKLACDGQKTGKAKDQKAPKKIPVMPKAGAACAACHGADGIGVSQHTPNLAGQQRSYLRRQLLLIREAAWGAAPRENESWRSHPIMERQAARITIEDVDALARYYAALDCRGAR